LFLNGGKTEPKSRLEYLYRTRDTRLVGQAQEHDVSGTPHIMSCETFNKWCENVFGGCLDFALSMARKIT